MQTAGASPASDVRAGGRGGGRGGGFSQGYVGPAVEIEGGALSPAQRERCAGGYDESQLRFLKAQVPPWR